MKTIIFLTSFVIGIIIIIFAEGTYKYIGGLFLLICIWYIILAILGLGKAADKQIAKDLDSQCK